MKTINLLHLANKKLCLKNAKWRGDTLCCSKCGQAIAYRYIFDGKVRVYVCEGFRKYSNQIEEREDNQTITSVRDSLGDIHFDEFNEVVDDLRQATRELLFVQASPEWVPEDCESEDSDGASEDDNYIIPAIEIDESLHIELEETECENDESLEVI